MQTFEAAARHSSFTRAADELHLTQGAISQQVKALEERLCVQLFFRNTRSLELTAAGQFLYQPIRTLLSQLEHIVDSVEGIASTNELVVYAPPCVSTKWLIPRIGDFRQRYSDVHLCFKVGASPPEMTSKEKRVSITIGAGTRSDNTRLEYLRSDSIFPVCSPSLLPSGLSLRQVSDLQAFSLLDVSGPEGNGSGSDWLSWLSLCGEESRVRKPMLRFDNSLLALQAAITGSGIALARSWVAEPDLLSGCLVKPLDIEVNSEDGYYLAYPKDLENCEQIVCFREWLFEIVNSNISREVTPPSKFNQQNQTG